MYEYVITATDAIIIAISIAANGDNSFMKIATAKMNVVLMMYDGFDPKNMSAPASFGSGSMENTAIIEATNEKSLINGNDTSDIALKINGADTRILARSNSVNFLYFLPSLYF